MAQTPTARTTNTWDDENRRTNVLLPSGAITTSTYRWDGLRHKKQTAAGTKKFVFDGQNYLLETNASNVVQAVCTNSPEQYGNLISQYDPNSAAAVYHHYDALGSTRQLTDSSRSVVNTYVYDAWGQAVSVSETVHNFFRWIGKFGYYFDDDVEGYYVRARHYGATIGRWLSQDPLFYPLGRHRIRPANLYSYITAPTTAIDPSGLQGFLSANDEDLEFLRQQLGQLTWDPDAGDDLIPPPLDLPPTGPPGVGAGPGGGDICIPRIGPGGQVENGCGLGAPPIDLGRNCSRAACQDDCNVVGASCLGVALATCCALSGPAFGACISRFGEICFYGWGLCFLDCERCSNP